MMNGIGLCLPSSCDSTDVHALAISLFERKSLAVQKRFEINFEVVMVRNSSLQAFTSRPDVRWMSGYVMNNPYLKLKIQN